MTINHEMVREGINHFEAEDAARHSADFSNLARCYLDMKKQRDAAVATGAVKTRKAIAEHFGVKQPSTVDWVKKGAISKDKLHELWRYFFDVAGPEDWGMTQGEWPLELSEGSKAGLSKVAIHPDVIRLAKRILSLGEEGRIAIELAIKAKGAP